MSFEMPVFGLAAAEIFVLCMVCIVLVFDVFSNDPERRWTYWLTLATVIGAAFLTWNIDGQPRQLTFADTFISDGISRLLKLFTYAVILLVFIYSMKYLRDRLLVKGEFLILGLFALLGVMVLASAHHFLTLYLGLELLSLSLYAMVAFDRDSPVAAESAMKYFVLGAIASGCLLYGMSVLYGVSGTLELGAVGAALSADLSGGERVAMLLGLSFVLVAVAFKLGAVPFHMWIPDVYHGAPTASTLFIGSVSKIAAFALIFRLLIDGLGDLYTSWRDMLMVMSVLSMAIGNLVAIAQTNIKRMLAYSTISHVGFILMGFLGPGEIGQSAAMFYTLAYVIMAAGAFGMIILLGREGFEADEIDDFRGLNQRGPWFAFIMLMLMFSMAGVPPFVGFWAKLAVIQAALEAQYLSVALAGVIFSVIGAFYYLRVVKVMYFDAPGQSGQITAEWPIRVFLSVNGLVVLALGIVPGVLTGWVASALR